MRAALYNGKKSIEMTELPTPEAGENDIVVKNYLCKHLRYRCGRL